MPHIMSAIIFYDFGEEKCTTTRPLSLFLNHIFAPLMEIGQYLSEMTKMWKVIAVASKLFTGPEINVLADVEQFIHHQVVVD